MKFIATKWAEDYDITKDDPDAPKIGEAIPEEGGGGVVGKVQRVSNIEMMKMVAESLNDEEDAFDACLTVNGKTFIIWKERG